jgi:hypothetical protein
MTHNIYHLKGTVFIKRVVVLLLFIISKNSFGQSIHFHYTDGANTSYNLVDVRKITFDADVMNLHLLDGSVYAWNVSTIGYYQYDASSLNLQQVLNDMNALAVMVFPNPTNSILNVQFNLPASEETFLRLYDMKGQLFTEKNLGVLSPGSHLAELLLENLAQGTYVIQLLTQHNSVTKQVFKQ